MTTGDRASSSTSTDSEDTANPACGLKGDPGDFPCELECDVFEQNCRRGEKCAPWADDASTVWNATKCVPVDRMPDPIGEPCLAAGNAFSGVDSCELGALCFNVDAKTNAGQCYALCEGSLSSPSCDEGAACWVHSEQVLTLCIPTCDPTAPQTCGTAEVCVPGDDGFFCVPSGPADGTFLEECASADACGTGLFCALPDRLQNCESDVGCCTPYCDLDVPVCPDATECEPYFGQAGAPQGLEHVGVCIN